MLQGQREPGTDRKGGKTVAERRVPVEWRTSSYSTGDGGQCVEVASGNGVAVRDTKNRDGKTLTFTANAWAAFAASLK